MSPEQDQIIQLLILDRTNRQPGSAPNLTAGEKRDEQEQR